MRCTSFRNRGQPMFGRCLSLWCQSLWLCMVGGAVLVAMGLGCRTKSPAAIPRSSKTGPLRHVKQEYTVSVVWPRPSVPPNGHWHTAVYDGASVARPFTPKHNARRCRGALYVVESRGNGIELRISIRPGEKHPSESIVGLTTVAVPCVTASKAGGAVPLDFSIACSLKAHTPYWLVVEHAWREGPACWLVTLATEQPSTDLEQDLYQMLLYPCPYRHYYDGPKPDGKWSEPGGQLVAALELLE